MADITIDKLNEKEKLHFMAGNTFWSFGGIERLQIPALKVSDASNGIRQQYKDESYGSKVGSIPAICYPSLCACGCSFDAESVYEMGRALGEECRSRHIAVLLGPGINIKRNPLCGRNFEYISEDPVLSGKLGAAFIKGVQSVGVAACVKHFALNSQETRRANSDSVADPKTMWEIYLRNFEIAVKEGRPWVVMGAYNKLNGIYCCENSWLLNDILRKEWGFDGVTVSDWGGVNDVIRSFNSGLDVEMPGGVNKDEEYIEKCAQAGLLRAEAVDRAAEDILLLTKRTASVSDKFSYSETRHLEAARKMAESSFVLLKNSDGFLPLKKDSKILVVGEMAKHPRYQGHGSGKVKLSHAETPWDSMRKFFSNISFEAGYDKDPEICAEKEKRAVLAAEHADAVIFFAGQDENNETEGFDRADMKLPPEQNRIILALARQNKNTAVIVQSGAPVEMLWRHDVKAVLMCYFSGSCFGSALLNVISGRVSPSGKLAETFPDRLKDTAAYGIYPAREYAVYEEGCEVGYRYYNKYKIETAYPFGFGLSYTEFKFTDLKAEFKNGRIAVSCMVENAGNMPAKAVVQIYIRAEESISAPVLAAFDKVYLEAGESLNVDLNIDPKYIAEYDESGNAYIMRAGAYEISTGHSSADLSKKTMFSLEESLIYPFSIDSGSKPYFVSRNDGERVTINSTLRDFEDKKVMKPVIGAVRMISKRVENSIVPSDRIAELVMDTPFRHLPMGTDGLVNMGHVKKVVKAANALLGKKQDRIPERQGRRDAKR